MKRLSALIASAFATLAAWQAEAAPVNIVSFTSNSTLTTSAATGGCATGQVAVVVVAMYNGVLIGVADSVAGAYTVSPTMFNVPNGGGYVTTLMGKRVVGAGNQITTSTTYTVSATGGSPSDMVVEAYCVTDGVGIPTANDSSIGADGSATAPAPTASSSYQIFAASAYGANPALTSGAPWTSLNHGLGPGGFAGLLVGYRQTGGTQAITWTGQGVAGFNAIGFAEVSTSGGGGTTKPHTLTTSGAG